MKKQQNVRKIATSSVAIATLSIAAVVVSAANLVFSQGGLSAQVGLFDWPRATQSAPQAQQTAPIFQILSCQYNPAGRNVSAVVKNVSGTSRAVPVAITIQLQDAPYTVLGSVNLTSPILGNNASTTVSAPVSLTIGARYTFTCCAGTVCLPPVDVTATEAPAPTVASSSRAAAAAVNSVPNNILGSADLKMLSPFSFTYGPTSDTFGISVKNIGDATTQFKPGQSTINAHVTIANAQRIVTTRILYFGAFTAGETKSSSFVQQPKLTPGSYTLTACVNIQSATATVAENVVETALANNCDTQQFVIQDTSSSSVTTSSRPPVISSSVGSSCRATLTCAACIRLQCRTVQVVPAMGVTSCEGMGLGLDSNMASCTATCGNVRVDVDGVTRTCS
jgi:hypothetical protein